MQRRTLMTTVAAALAFGAGRALLAPGDKKPFKLEEPDQMLEPIAL